MIIIYIKNNQKSLVLAFVFCFVSFYNSKRLLALGRVLLKNLCQLSFELILTNSIASFNLQDARCEKQQTCQSIYRPNFSG